MIFYLREYDALRFRDKIYSYVISYIEEWQSRIGKIVTWISMDIVSHCPNPPPVVQEQCAVFTVLSWNSEVHELIDLWSLHWNCSSYAHSDDDGRPPSHFVRCLAHIIILHGNMLFMCMENGLREKNQMHHTWNLCKIPCLRTRNICRICCIMVFQRECVCVCSGRMAKWVRHKAHESCSCRCRNIIAQVNRKIIWGWSAVTLCRYTATQLHTHTHAFHFMKFDIFVFHVNIPFRLLRRPFLVYIPWS